MITRRDILVAVGAVLLVHRLFLRLAPPATAVWGLAFFAFNPVAPVLQVPYAESLHLLLLAGALLLVARGSHLAAAPVVLLMCLTRPAGVPFAAALGITWFVRSVRRYRAGELRRAAEVAGRRIAGLGPLGQRLAQDGQRPAQQPRDVHLGHPQLGRDLPVGVAGGDQPGHLQLAGGQR